jgi:hypothetical protein
MSEAARNIPGYKGPYNPKPRPLPDGEAFISIYNYVPSMALGVLAAALFAVAFIGHTYFWVRGRRIRWFQGLMAFGCVRTLTCLEKFYCLTTYNCTFHTGNGSCWLWIQNKIA